MEKLFIRVFSVALPDAIRIWIWIILKKSHNWFKCLFLEAFSLFANDNQNFNIYSKPIQSIKIYYQEVCIEFCHWEKCIKKLLQIICWKERGEEKIMFDTGIDKALKAFEFYFNNNIYFQAMKLS